MAANAEITIPDDLADLLRAARKVTVLTGAGISAESGIPTFRDSQTGMWARYNPHELATPEAFSRNPQLVMDWYRWRKELVSNSAPNAGHHALAMMERRVHAFSLITQNIDGLHRASGSINVIEMHGSLQRLRCSNNGCQFTTGQWPEQGLAYCDVCGSLLRPDIVWFGEELPKALLLQAIHESRSCDLFFSIGTSGVVEPAASLPYEALRSGAVVVEINPIPTPLNIHSRFYLPYPAGQALPALASQTWGHPVD